MPQFRKKPVVIEAEQWKGDPREMPVPPAPSDLLAQSPLDGRWRLKTLEDWISKHWPTWPKKNK